MAKTEVAAAVTINASELQRFSDVWSPVINALPTIINALGQRDDLNRHIAILTSQRDAVVKEAEEAKERLAANVAAARETLVSIEKERIVESDALKAAKKLAADEKKALEFSVNAAREASQTQIALSLHLAAEAEADKKKRVAAVDLEVSNAKAAAAVEIEAIEKRRASAQASLDRLRAKLEG